MDARAAAPLTGCTTRPAPRKTPSSARRSTSTLSRCNRRLTTSPSTQVRFSVTVKPTNDYGQRNFESTDTRFKLFRYIVCVVAGLVLFCVPTLSIAFGAMYWSECPVQPVLPAYLVVVGSIGVFRNILTIRIVMGPSATPVSATLCGGKTEFVVLVDALLVSWFVIGTVWTVHALLNRSDDPTSDSYCHPRLFGYTCALVFGVYAIFLLALVFALVHHITQRYSLAVAKPPPPSYRDCTAP